ncbi:probable cell division cycle-associated 7-like protein at N-terminal half [Coccomyxa sp. Obi]|nr:probable cell division cycle-associated 7-like protein at N-terminal half [Coccomyxa sp. Obi]
MEEMGIFELSNKLQQTVQRRSAANKPQRRAPSANRANRDLVDAPKRKSSRLEGRPALNYNENALDLVDRPERKQRSTLLDRHVISQEEIYTEEHVKLLGEYKEPWELFKDGYDAQGNRIYDKISGMTCHQCRQKTLGLHTSCSECQTLHGVFCGDCLFMRYGENILEVQAMGAWVCPPCRGLCNCSFHRIRAGWAPTGTLYRRAIAEGYKSVAHYLVLTKLATAAEEGAAAADANAAAAPAEDACAEEPTSTAPVTRQRKSSPAKQELPAAAAPPVADAQPVQSPQEEGNAAADVPAKTGNKGSAKRGRTKEAASPGVPVRQEKIDTILSKAKSATGSAKSLAGKALTKMAAALAGTGEGRGLGKRGRGKVDSGAEPRVTRASSGAPVALGVKKTAMACVRKATRSRS